MRQNVEQKTQRETSNVPLDLFTDYMEGRILNECILFYLKRKEFRIVRDSFLFYIFSSDFAGVLHFKNAGFYDTIQSKTPLTVPLCKSVKIFSVFITHRRPEYFL